MKSSTNSYQVLQPALTVVLAAATLVPAPHPDCDSTPMIALNLQRLGHQGMVCKCAYLSLPAKALPAKAHVNTCAAAWLLLEEDAAGHRLRCR